MQRDALCTKTDGLISAPLAGDAEGVGEAVAVTAGDKKGEEEEEGEGEGERVAAAWRWFSFCMHSARLQTPLKTSLVLRLTCAGCGECERCGWVRTRGYGCGRSGIGIRDDSSSSSKKRRV